MNASQSRRLAAAEQRLAAARSTPNSGLLLGWLATPDAQQILELAAAGESYQVDPDVRRAGQHVVNALGLRRLDAARIETLTRAELVALVAAAA